MGFLKFRFEEGAGLSGPYALSSPLTANLDPAAQKRVIRDNVEKLYGLTLPN